MTIGIMELSNRRSALLQGRTIKKLKDQRKETRAVMQRFEGSTDLSDEEKTTYAHLTLSMVILNALSDHLLKEGFIPKTWDVFTLGSDFDKHLTPMLRKNEEGELWVEYFDCDRPKDALVLLAGEAAQGIAENAPVVLQRHKMRRQPAQTARDQGQPVETSVMDLIRTRMPNMAQARYSPKRS